MKATTVGGAIGALAIATQLLAGETQPPMSIHIGTFENIGWGEIRYDGGFEHRVAVTAQPQNGTMFPTAIAIDLSGLLAEQGFSAFTAITVADSGNNVYTSNSPGADIDWFAIDGLDQQLSVSFTYDGTVPVHQQEDSDTLALRVADLNALSGQTHLNSFRHVSLGKDGNLTAHIAGWSGGGGADGGTGGGDPDDGSGGGPIIPLPRGIDSNVSLWLSESGMGESFDVYITPTNVPAPGALAVLGLAGLASRRRRRPL